MPQSYGITQQAPPTPLADGNQVELRTTRYGDLWVPMTPGNMQASEGTYFRATNPTPNTAIAQAVTATFGATTPWMIIRNTDAAAGKTLYLDYIRMFMTVIPASGTTWDIAVISDPTNRYTSSGTALTAVNANTGFSTASIASVIVGSPTTAAASAPRLLSRARIFNVVPVVNSQLVVAFGANDFNQTQTINGTNAVNLYVPCGPVALAPGANHSLLFYSWYASNTTTPPQFEIEVGWWER